MDLGVMGSVIALGGPILYLFGYLRIKGAISERGEDENTVREIRSAFRGLFIPGNLLILIGLALALSSDQYLGEIFFVLILGGVGLLTVGFLLYRFADGQDLPFKVYGMISFYALAYLIVPGTLLLFLGLWIMSMLIGISNRH
jgi:hypothetical protein